MASRPNGAMVNSEIPSPLGGAGGGVERLTAGADVPQSGIAPIGGATSASESEMMPSGVLRRLQGHDGLVIVEDPPVLDDVAASKWIVAPWRDGTCDLQAEMIAPLAGAGMIVEPTLGTDGGLLGVIIIPGVAGRDAPTEDDPGAEPNAERRLIPRTYHLRPTTINSLRACAVATSAHLGHHVTKSEIVGVAIRTSPVLSHVDLLGIDARLTPRTYHLRPMTIAHLEHVAMLAPEIVGRHVRLSHVVDVAIRLFCRESPGRRAELITENRRRTLANRA